VPPARPQSHGTAGSHPAGLKLKGSTGKYLFKKAMEPFLPDSTIYRNKMGFAIPLADWFRGGIRDFASAYVAEEKMRIFRRRLFERSGTSTNQAFGPSTQLWNVLMFRLCSSVLAEGDVRVFLASSNQGLHVLHAFSHAAWKRHSQYYQRLAADIEHQLCLLTTAANLSSASTGRCATTNSTSNRVTV